MCRYYAGLQSEYEDTCEEAGSEAGDMETHAFMVTTSSKQMPNTVTTGGKPPARMAALAVRWWQRFHNHSGGLLRDYENFANNLRFQHKGI